MSDHLIDSFYSRFYRKNKDNTFEGEKHDTFEEFCEATFNGAFKDYKWLEHHFTLHKRLISQGERNFQYMIRNVVMPLKDNLFQIITNLEKDN